MLSMTACNLCPRGCGVDRRIATGFCGCGDRIYAARAALHFFEEPCISGRRGSGTVFFSGCTLRCRYCQNYAVSNKEVGREITVERLAQIFLELQARGAHNLNLVTATQFLLPVLEALELVKGRLKIPVVYNCGGYEREEAVKALAGYADIFLPDFKYRDGALAVRYSQAPACPDYFETASRAVRAMIDTAGPPRFDPAGMLQKGVIIRHLVLPGHRDDSIALLRFIKQSLPRGGFLLSLMSQYTPYRPDPLYRNLNRRLTSLEYSAVVREAVRLGLTDGYMQEKSSAKEEYTPPFDLSGL